MSPTRRILRSLGAIAVAIGGAHHVYLYDEIYRFFPNANLGRSFLANGVVSAAVVISLIMWRSPLAELAGIVVSVGSIGAFAATRNGVALFGLTEKGWEPSPHAARTVGTEVLAVILLSAALLVWKRTRRPSTLPS